MKIIRLLCVVGIAIVFALPPEVFAAGSRARARTAPNVRAGARGNRGARGGNVNRNTNIYRRSYNAAARAYRAQQRAVRNYRNRMSRMGSRNRQSNQREKREREREKRESNKKKPSPKGQTVKITRAKPSAVIAPKSARQLEKPAERSPEGTPAEVLQKSAPAASTQETKTEASQRTPSVGAQSTSRTGPWQSMSDTEMRIQKARELEKLGRVVDWRKYTYSQLCDMERRLRKNPR